MRYMSIKERKNNRPHESAYWVRESRRKDKIEATAKTSKLFQVGDNVILTVKKVARGSLESRILICEVIDMDEFYRIGTPRGILKSGFSATY